MREGAAAAADVPPDGGIFELPADLAWNSDARRLPPSAQTGRSEPPVYSRRRESRYGCPPPERMTVCTYRIVYHCKTHSRDPANQTTLFCPITLHTSRSVRHVRPSSTPVLQLTLSPFASAKFSNFICIPAKVWYNIFLLTEFVIFPEILCSSLKPFFAVR